MVSDFLKKEAPTPFHQFFLACGLPWEIWTTPGPFSKPHVKPSEAASGCEIARAIVAGFGRISAPNLMSEGWSILSR